MAKKAAKKTAPVKAMKKPGKPEKQRSFTDGKMVETQPQVAKELTVVQLQKRLANIDKRIARLQAKKVEVQGWIDQANDSV